MSYEGHLREEKDPFRCAAALAHLPQASRISVTHLGGAMNPGMAAEARRWAEANGLLAELAAAVQEINFRLTVEPHEWGES